MAKIVITCRTNPFSLVLPWKTHVRKLSSSRYIQYSLTSPSWSYKTARAIVSHLSDVENQLIYNHFSGSGLLVQDILRETHYTVGMYEPRQEFLESNEVMIRSNKELILFENDIFSIKGHNKAEKNCKITKHNWSSDPPLSIITGGNSNHIRGIIYNCVKDISTMQTACAYGRPQLFLLTPEDETKNMLECSKWRRRRSFFYRVFLDISKLLEIPSCALSGKPATLDSSHGVRSVQCEGPFNGKVFSLMKLVFKRDIFEEVCARHDVPHLLYLQSQMAKNKKHRVIPWLERHCPGIGPFLIEQGITMTQLIKELDHNLLPVIYKELVRQPAFLDSGLIKDSVLRNEEI